MHIHILGICGTFMGGLAALAREAGHRVTGCDANVYPPMSDQLQSLGIELIEGYGTDQLALTPHLFVVEDVGVVELEVVEHRRARAVVHELAALVEEGGVVFVRLDDEGRTRRIRA